MRSRFVLTAMAGLIALIAEDEPGQLLVGSVIPQANAEILLPKTPRSVAGVARRTTRRVVRRSTEYVTVLPAGCKVVVVDGVSLHQCGGVYYEPYQNKYVVVVVE